MGFRIEAQDLHTGQPVAPYETRADSETEARAEAARLGVHILSLTRIDEPAAEATYSAPTLADWKLVPLLVCKPYVFAQLRRLHAPGGLDSSHRFRANEGQLLHFDGLRESTLRAEQVASVHDLPHFVLISTHAKREIAIPKSAFHSATLARRFIITLAEAASIEPALDFHSEWVGQRKPAAPIARLLGQFILFALGAVMLMLLLMLFTL